MCNRTPNKMDLNYCARSLKRFMHWKKSNRPRAKGKNMHCSRRKTEATKRTMQLAFLWRAFGSGKMYIRIFVHGFCVRHKQSYSFCVHLLHIFCEEHLPSANNECCMPLNKNPKKSPGTQKHSTTIEPSAAAAATRANIKSRAIAVNALKLLCIMYQFEVKSKMYCPPFDSNEIAFQIPSANFKCEFVCVFVPRVSFDSVCECQREIAVQNPTAMCSAFLSWNPLRMCSFCRVKRMKYHSNSSYSFHLFIAHSLHFWMVRRGPAIRCVHCVNSFVEQFDPEIWRKTSTLIASALHKRNARSYISVLWPSKLTTFVNYCCNYTHVNVD